MPKTKISEWSSTPANNTDIDGINIAEGMAPSNVNDAMREMMSQIKDWQAGTSGDYTAVSAGGTGVGTLTGIVKGNGTSAFTAVTAPSGAIVGTTDTQTLTNKTLTYPAIDNPQLGYTTTATAAGTTTLTVTSNHQQFFTGTTTQTIVLPVTSTLALGVSYLIENNSTGLLTVQSSGLNAITTIPTGVTALFTCILTSGTTAASWDFTQTGFATITGTGSAVLGTSPTITTAALTNPTVTNYVETPFTANSSTAITLALTNGTVQIITLTGNATITMPTATSGKSFILFLKQDATGSRTVTWSTVKWPAGTAPTITSTASRQDILSFFADGTNWYGTTVGQNYTP
jgi:hypothetical protein